VDWGEPVLEAGAVALAVRGTRLAPRRPAALHPPPCTAPFGRHHAVGWPGVTARLLGARPSACGSGQHRPEGDLLVGDGDPGAPRGLVSGWAAARRLGDKDAAIPSAGHEPLQPMAPRQAFALLLGTLPEERPARLWREARRRHRHGRLRPWLAGPLWDDGRPGPLQCGLGTSAEIAVGRGLVGHRPPPQGQAQHRVCGAPAYDCTTGPVVIAQPAPKGAQLRLRTAPGRELAVVGRPHGLAHWQRTSGTVHAPNLGHGAHLPPNTDARGPRMSTEPKYLKDQDNEMVLEWTHAMTLAPWLTLQPDIPYVIKPSGMSQIANALVLAMQIAVNFWQQDLLAQRRRDKPAVKNRTEHSTAVRSGPPKFIRQAISSVPSAAYCAISSTHSVTSPMINCSRSPSSL
jgi:Carbohydrate-selective porin, OprB family